MHLLLGGSTKFTLCATVPKINIGFGLKQRADYSEERNVGIVISDVNFALNVCSYDYGIVFDCIFLGVGLSFCWHKL